MSDSDGRDSLLPTGTVTLLLTDLEASSRSWEDAPEAMAIAVSRHYALLDGAIAAHGGVRPVEQGEGDSVVAAFSRASDAVAAAAAAQRALSTEPWPEGAVLRARIAVHSGEVELRDEGNYFGPTVIRCARLRAIGHGGQVLVSDAAAGLVAGRLGDGVGLFDLGVHRLRDLGRPERVWQLTGPELASGFPPLRSLDAFQHNLPVQLTPLIGRRGDIATVQGLLDGERIVTLTGSGGVGKTRLALAVGANVVDRYAGGVWWVDLASVADGTRVGQAVLAVLDAPEVAGVDVAHQVALALGSSPALVVLDNCEHLVGACAELVAELLSDNGAVTVLATSREPLGVPGEIIWRVPSLAAPPLECTWSVLTLPQYEAVELFIDRARRARPSFVVSEANASAVAEICRRLDGIPLAIELAAARCRQLAAEQIAAELGQRFRLLTGGARTAMARQQTLAASVQWSHDRLEPLEQRVFRRLAVFPGHFPLRAAEEVVASLGDVDLVEVFDAVSRLVDKSLVVTVEEAHAPPEPRYRLLETLRTFGLARAEAEGELDQLRTAHAKWWATWLAQRFYRLHTDPLTEEVEEFHENIAAALDWSLDDPEFGLQLLRLVTRAWHCSGRGMAAMPAVDRLLTDENAEHFGEAWCAAAVSAAVLVATARGPRAFLTLLARVEVIANGVDDPWWIALVRWLRGFGVPESQTVCELAQEHGDAYVEALASIALVETLTDTDPAEASAYLAHADAIAAQSQSSYLRDLCQRQHARIARDTGELATAIHLARELASAKTPLMMRSAIGLLSTAGLLAADTDALHFALDTAERVTRLGATDPELLDLTSHRVAYLVEHRAGRYSPESILDQADTGDLWVSCREAIDAGATTAVTANKETFGHRGAHGQAALSALEAAIGGGEASWHTALKLSVDHGLRLIAVDAIEGLAVAASATESWAECLRLLGAAARLRNETGYRWRFGFEQRPIDKAAAAAAHALGDRAPEASAEGGTLDWHAAAAYAQRARGERKRPSHGWESLTPTEQQVVALLAHGLTNPEIAKRLFVARGTVKTHLEHIFTKTGVRTRAQLAAEAALRNSRPPV